MNFYFLLYIQKEREREREEKENKKAHIYISYMNVYSHRFNNAFALKVQSLLKD